MQCKSVLKGRYIDGDCAFYILVFDDREKTRDVTSDIILIWNLHWIVANERFEELLKSTPELVAFSGKMFFVWDGNHRFIAWSRYISELHADDPGCHYVVQSIVLNPSGQTSLLLSCMHDVS